MASILIKLDKRRANAENKYPVKIIIFNNQSNASISINISLPETAWLQDGLQRPVKSNYPASKIYNDTIEKNYLNIKKKLFELEENGVLNGMKAADIKKYILSERVQHDKNETNFFEFAFEYIESCKTSKTKETYQYTIQKLKKFNRFILNFEDINFAFLRNFDDHLSRTGSGVNSRSIHFRNIRTLFNRAIDDELINPGLYPFRKFKIRNEQRDKECLTAEQVRMLYEYNFETDALCMARDFWILSFLLCGINPVDLFNLKKPDKDNRVTFIRSKMRHSTNDYIKLLLQPEALEIVSNYTASVDSEYLLKFESKYINYDSFKHFLSKKIREISKILYLPGLTMYWARYTWATIADKLNIPEKIISKGLGHADKSMAGRKYISFDWSKVDAANREVIDFVLGNR